MILVAVAIDLLLAVMQLDRVGWLATDPVFISAIMVRSIMNWFLAGLIVTHMNRCRKMDL